MRNTGRCLLAGGAIALVAGGVTSARADELQRLEAQLEAMQAQIRDLQRQIKENRAATAAAKADAARADDAATAAAAAAADAARAEAAAAAARSAAAESVPQKKDDDLDLKVKWKGAPELSSRDGRFRAKVRGRLHLDYNNIDQDQAITGQPDVSAFEIRRARLGIEGVLWKDVEYKFEVDFAHDETAIKDAYLEYVGLCEGLGIRVGNFKTFNSLEHLTSSNYITFMERAAFIEGFQIDRQIGVGAIFAQDHYTLAAGVFGPHPFDDTEWLRNVKTGAARVTVAPINNDHAVVHFGASWRQRHGAEDLRAAPIPINDEFFLYRARGADLHLADRFVETPEIFNKDTFWGLEAAVVWGPWSVQGEYGQLQADVGPEFTGADPTYQGWYVDTSYFLTGETRPYKYGEFTRPKVLNPVFEGGHGAWQIAGRYDVINFSDAAAAIPFCVECGDQRTWLIGVNWWLNDHTRLMFNYNESTIAGGFLDGANVNDGAKIRGFGTRAQVDW